MQLQNEILNIEYHKVRLILKSLNLSNNMQKAAENCGISKRSLQDYIKNYKITQDGRRWISNAIIKYNTLLSEPFSKI